MTLRALSPSQQEALVVAFERSCTRISAQRRRRLVEILRRHVFGSDLPKTLYSEFRISKQRFFIERQEVLRRIDALVRVQAGLHRSTVALEEPSRLQLTQARALYAAGNASAAAARLERIDDSSLAAGERFDALRISIDALDESGMLALREEQLDRRIRRWYEASIDGTSDRHLRTRLGNVESGRKRSALAVKATTLIRRALSSGDPAVAVAYGRVLTQSTFIFLDEGDVALAESQLFGLRELSGYPRLSSMFAADWGVLNSAVHWFDPAKARLARVERRTAFDLATQSSDMHTTWACLYFEIRDQFAQKNFSLALKLAEELLRSARAAGNGEWRRLAQGALVDAHLLAGQLDDAKRTSALASQDAFSQTHLTLNLACKVASLRRDFRTLLALSTAFVEGSGRLNKPSVIAAALRHRARAAYHIGDIRAAVAAVEDAVAVCESHGWTEPWDLQRTYDQAARITNRPRYRETLTDITSTLHPKEPAAEVLALCTSNLSQRQLQTARLAATGLTNDAIGRTLGISSRTVEKHLEAVFAHFAIQSRRQLRTIVTL
jgi:DNA-binding CsgD family transcriptional regulator